MIKMHLLLLKKCPEVTFSGVQKLNYDTFDNYKREKDLYYRSKKDKPDSLIDFFPLINLLASLFD